MYCPAFLAALATNGAQEPLPVRNDIGLRGFEARETMKPCCNYEDVMLPFLVKVKGVPCGETIEDGPTMPFSRFRVMKNLYMRASEIRLKITKK